MYLLNLNMFSFLASTFHIIYRNKRFYNIKIIDKTFTYVKMIKKTSKYKQNDPSYSSHNVDRNAIIDYNKYRSEGGNKKCLK